MKNFKKFAALFLVFVMILGCVGCSKDSGSTGEGGGTTATTTTPSTDKKDDTTTAPAKTDEPAQTPDAGGDVDTGDAGDDTDVDVPVVRDTKAYVDDDGIWRYSDTDEIVDLGGMTITIGQWFLGTDREDPQTASEIARCDYLDEIESTYHFTIVEEKLGVYGDMPEIVNNFCTSGGDENYVFCVYNNMITTPMRNGLFYDLSSLDCLDLTDTEKWDVSTSEKMHLGDKIYGMRNGSAEPRGGLYFNMRMLEEAGVDPDSIYDMQANHTWTWDAFEDLCKKLTRDTNGDGEIDIYAMSSFCGESMNTIIASNGAQIIDYDENGNFINATNTDNFLEAYDWAHTLRQQYEAPQPEGTEWDYSYGMFMNAEVCMTICEQYHSSTFKQSMDDDFGFVVFPMGPAMDDYNGYSTDNAYAIPAVYDEERAWNIAFAYNLFTEPTPGYDDEDDEDWKTYYYTVFCDERAVDETLAILRDHQTACIYPLVPNVNHDNDYWYNIDVETGAERYETMKDQIQALIDAVQ